MQRCMVRGQTSNLHTRPKVATESREPRQKSRRNMQVSRKISPGLKLEKNPTSKLKTSCNDACYFDTARARLNSLNGQQLIHAIAERKPRVEPLTSVKDNGRHSHRPGSSAKRPAALAQPHVQGAHTPALGMGKGAPGGAP